MSKALIIPFVVVVLGQVLYHSLLRQLPKGIPALALISLTYAIGAVVGGVLWWLVPADAPVAAAPSVVETLPWAAGLAVAILLVEVGYVYAYRAGLPLSVGALTVFAVTTALLVPISFMAFHDRMSWLQWLGMVLVLGGSWLVLGTNPA